MLNKKKTIRMRLTIYSLLIMVMVILLTVSTVYFLQGFSKEQMVINANDIKYAKFDNGNQIGGIVELENSQEIITKIQREMAEQQQTLFIRLVGISSLILLAGGTLIYLLTKKELEPLESLRKEVEVVDFQNQKNRIKVDSKLEEIVTLANSFNTMLQKLEANYLMQKKFAQNAAHELKTPITTMKTTIQVARMTNKDHEIVYDNLEDQVTRMSHLVHELLTLNRRSKVDFEVVDVRKLIEEKCSALTKIVEEKKIDLEIEGEMTLKTDGRLLGLALNNIIENAIKYNKVDGKVSISLDKTIKIVDTGIGIDCQELENIFIPFYCVDESRSKALGGFGLGLSIVKECLDVLEYKCKVTSVLEEGTTVEIFVK